MYNYFIVCFPKGSFDLLALRGCKLAHTFDAHWRYLRRRRWVKEVVKLFAKMDISNLALAALACPSHMTCHCSFWATRMCQLQFVDTAAGAEGDLSYEEFAAEIQVQVDSSRFKLIQRVLESESLLTVQGSPGFVFRFRNISGQDERVQECFRHLGINVERLGMEVCDLKWSQDLAD